MPEFVRDRKSAKSIAGKYVAVENAELVCGL